MVPTPPEIAGQRPEALLCGRDEAVEGAGFANDGGDLVGGFGQHADFIFAKDARFLGLDDENALQDSAIDEGNAEKGVVLLFAGFLEVFEAGMIAWRHATATGITCSATRPARPSLSGMRSVPMHARVQAEGRGKHEIGAIWLKEIGRAHVGAEARGNKGDDIHQGVGGLAAFLGEVGDLFQSQYTAGFGCIVELGHARFLTLNRIGRKVCIDTDAGLGKDAEVQSVESSFGINVDFLRPLKGVVFLMKTPLNILLLVYTDSETAVMTGKGKN